MPYPKLDMDAVAAFAGITGSSHEVTRALFAVGYYRNLLLLRRIQSFLELEATQWARATGFIDSFEMLRSQPAVIQHRVLGHPSAAFWLDVVQELIARRAHERFPEMHFGEHLATFSRLAAAAMHISGQGEMVCTVTTDPSGRISLPGARISIVPQDALPCSRVRLRICDGEISLGSMGSPRNMTAPIEVRTVGCLRNGVEVNGIDYDLRLGGRTNHKFEELSVADTYRWMSSLDHCWSLIAEVSPILADEMLLGVTTIVPVHCSRRDLHLSGSFREAPGLVAMSLGDTKQTTEALVHEYCHQKLYALMNLDALVIGPTTEAAYYSPWKEDARPLMGLLHAIYSFTGILGFYSAMMRSAPEAVRSAETRIYQIGEKIRIGLTELHKHANLSPFGTTLVEALALRCDEYRRDLPLPPKVDRQHSDEVLREHRRRWDERYSRQVPAIGILRADHNVTLDPTRVAHNERDLAILHMLGLSSDWFSKIILRQCYPGDSLLEIIRASASDETAEFTLAEITEIAKVDVRQSLVADLIAGHLAYVQGQYYQAVDRYRACINHDAYTPYFWQCYAFAMRHLGHYEEALYILVHTHEIIHKLRTVSEPALHDPLILAGPEINDRSWRLQPPDQASFSASSPSVTLPDDLARATENSLRGSRYWRFIEATRCGAQLPTLIAVAAGLKPAMDVWIPLEGWHSFTELISTLDLKYFVDSYFDRHCAELSDVPKNQLTTTRAGFRNTFCPGTEAHVFVAREEAPLHEAVAAGWYPLVVEGHVVNKHRADHDKFGDALGYPRCCQVFFRERNNWHEDNTYYAALGNTHDHPSILCNPFLRHTIFGLVPYMPCSYSCHETIRYATALLKLISTEVPNYAWSIEHSLSKPILCLSEIRIYHFNGTMNGASAVHYSTVESLYPVESQDPVLQLLSMGNRCVLRTNVVNVYRDHRHVGCHVARNDKHGPECPFLISFQSGVSTNSSLGVQ